MANFSKKIDNSLVRKFLMDQTTGIYDISSYEYEIPRWVDDCIRGGISAMGSTRSPSNFKVYQYLTCLEELTLSAVAEVISVKRRAIEGVGYSEGYNRKWFALLRNASQAINHQLTMKPELLLGGEAEYPKYVPAGDQT